MPFKRFDFLSHCFRIVWMNNPTEQEIRYAEELQADFNNFNSNDFGLYNLLI